MALLGGAREASFSLATSTAGLPVAPSTSYSATCWPLSSRCTKETFEPSGLHFRSSGPRPSMPPGLNISSIVSSFFACDSCDEGEGTDCASKNEVDSTQQTNAANRVFTLAPTRKICSGKVYIRTAGLWGERDCLNTPKTLLRQPASSQRAWFLRARIPAGSLGVQMNSDLQQSE